MIRTQPMTAENITEDVSHHHNQLVPDNDFEYNDHLNLIQGVRTATSVAWTHWMSCHGRMINT